MAQIQAAAGRAILLPGDVAEQATVERLVDGTAGARPFKVAPPGTSPALRALTAVGLAHGSGQTALVQLGIGSASDGALHEALNLAALLRPNVIFVVTVHPLDGDAPLAPQLAARAEAEAAARLAQFGERYALGFQSFNRRRNGHQPTQLKLWQTRHSLRQLHQPTRGYAALAVFFAHINLYTYI